MRQSKPVHELEKRMLQEKGKGKALVLELELVVGSGSRGEN